ncbi:hypothetical protein NHX12_014488 [Muraenolepis orangiensis]|uniref:Small integral membrane protein 20 n=1 Tax=Muraenolepis orangiensis TaxID=630683 RepID=A0A9Q0DEY6_9TELE|nr:hypothetical protein NHX12_014488 [Muraenolepis orangiensis]
MSRNARITLIFGGFVTAVAAAFYPIYYYPLVHTEDYKQVQKANRDGINQADIQPVGVKVWSDPYKPNNSSPLANRSPPCRQAPCDTADSQAASTAVPPPTNEVTSRRNNGGDIIGPLAPPLAIS